MTTEMLLFVYDIGAGHTITNTRPFLALEFDLSWLKKWNSLWNSWFCFDDVSEPAISDKDVQGYIHHFIQELPNGDVREALIERKQKYTIFLSR